MIKWTVDLVYPISHIRPESGCDGCDGCDGHIQPKMGHLQPSRVTSRVTSSQKWRTSSPPATFVRNRVLYVKFVPNIFSACSALSRHADQKITSRITSMQNSEDSSHIYHILNHIQESHPGKIQRPVTSEWSHPQKHPDKI